MKKVLVLMLLMATIACDQSYSGQWLHTGPVTVLEGGGIWRYDLKKPDGTTLIVNMCNSNYSPAWKTGMVIDAEYRIVNEYHTMDKPCWQMNTYKILQHSPSEN